ncbi:MAG: hypothetical protein AUJ01_03255 [Acidobacteria bacterium 13_1_40CM_3_65_5]|nr:MAG: hypothetical protein AUJ01_03255 [Acidobacteria bacterium 13_1_40CM_3_65_5]
MLDGAGNAECDVQLRRDRLSRAADLTLHRQPPGVADRTRCGDLGAECLGQFLRDLDVGLLLDAAADRHDALGLREIHRLLRLLERRLGRLADRRRVDVHVERANGAGVAKELAAAQVKEVVTVEHPALEPYTPDGYTAALQDAIAQLSPTYVLLPHTYQTRDFAPKLAARMDRAIITDVTAVKPAAVYPSGVYGSSAACSTVTISFTCAAASSLATLPAPAPGTKTAIGTLDALASCCAPTMVSHVARFNLPSLCSATTRITYSPSFFHWRRGPTPAAN